jgi:hypothetical protein
MKLLKLTVAALASALIALPATVSAAGDLTIALASEPSSSRRTHHRSGFRAVFHRPAFS